MQSRPASDPEAIQNVSHALHSSVRSFTSSSEPHRRQYMRQSVMLTGLSSPKFDEAIASVYAIQGMFKQTSVNRSMEEWTPSLFQEHLSIDVGNRYFTPRQFALQDQEVAFDASVDPDNILSQGMGDQLVHVEENHVEYYEARKEKGGTK